VISELFDLGVEGAEVLQAETPGLIDILDPNRTPEDLESATSSVMTVWLFLVPIVAQRRANPGDDVISALLHPSDGSEPLSDEDIILLCILMLPAGYKTTANLI